MELDNILERIYIAVDKREKSKKDIAVCSTWFRWPFFSDVMFIFCASIEFTQATHEFRVTCLHAREQRDDFHVAADIPLIFVVLDLIDNDFHVVI